MPVRSELPPEFKVGSKVRDVESGDIGVIVELGNNEIKVAYPNSILPNGFWRLAEYQDVIEE